MAVPGISESMKELYLLEGEWISDPLYRVVDRHASLNPTKLAISDQQVSLSYEDLRAIIPIANSLDHLFIRTRVEPRAIDILTPY